MASLIEDINFARISIPVTIKHKETILPAEPIPVNNGDTLYLSNLDDIIGCRVFTPTVYFYHSTPSRSRQVVKKLRDALALVLVPYYPFSGRIREYVKHSVRPLTRREARTAPGVKTAFI